MVYDTHILTSDSTSHLCLLLANIHILLPVQQAGFLDLVCKRLSLSVGRAVWIPPHQDSCKLWIAAIYLELICRYSPKSLVQSHAKFVAEQEI